jgi:AAA domain/DnaB-like helicase N terminal domain
LIASILTWPTSREIGLREVDGADFFDRTNGRSFDAIGLLHERGDHITPTTLADAMRSPGTAEIGDARLRDWFTREVVPAAVRQYAAIVRHYADARLIRGIGHSMMDLKALDADPHEVRLRAMRQLDAVMPGDGESELVTADFFEALHENPKPWLIPDFLTREMRAIVVAGEGSGKSTLLRQIAMLPAQGKHPLQFYDIEAIRTMIVDCENMDLVIAETAVKITRQLRRDRGDDYDSSRCVWLRRPAGLDLRSHGHRAVLERQLSIHKPDLVCIGPANKLLYKRPNENDEEATAPVLQVLDDLRARYGFALVVEHHGSKAERSKPVNSYRWMAWPDVGAHLAKTQQPGRLEVGRFRGDRLPVGWPSHIERGHTYPWEGVWEGGMDSPLAPPGEML